MRCLILAVAVWMAAACPTARAQPAPEILENSIGMKFVKIPAGEFDMGQDDDGVATRHAGPVHRVRISKPFYLGVYEVTNAQYKQVAGYDAAGTWKDADRPVTVVGPEGAAGFCKKLSDLPAEKKERRVYRLPTEAEWEYACRAGTKTRYSFGDDWKQLHEYGWFIDISQNQTQPVGKKKANPWGLHDMHGNVWEWCSDWYGPYGKDAATDPQGPAEGTERVIRGGSFRHSGGYCRSAARLGEPPRFARQSGNLSIEDAWGLRVAMTVSEPPPAEPGK